MDERWWNPMSWDAPFVAVAGALFAIVALRAGSTYLVGRLLRRGAERGGAARFVERPGFVHATDQLNQWGAPAVSLSFLTVGVQTMVNLAAGFTRMPLARYLPALIVGCIAWACLYATAGVVGFQAIVQLHRIHPALAWLLALAFVVVLASVVRSRRRPAGPATDPR